MIGAPIMVVVLLVVLPIGFMVTGAVFAATLGWFLRQNGEAENEGSELLDLNV